MARPARPWYWKARKIWCITHKGERFNLGPDRDEAFRQYHAIMAKPDQEYHPVQQGSVAAILDDFLAWTDKNRAAKTFTRYRDFIQSFVSKCGRMDAEDLNPSHVTVWLATHKGWNSTTKRNAITAEEFDEICVAGAKKQDSEHRFSCVSLFRKAPARAD